MSKEIKIVSNASISKLLTPDQNVKMALSELLSYYVAGYEKTISFKNERWDGRSTMFDWETNTFPTGFISVIREHLNKEGFEVINICKNLPEPLGVLHYKYKDFDFTGKYDYQIKTTEELLKRGSMIAHLATGAGKTAAASIAIHKINRPTLILTKRQPLMYQFVERLKTFDIDSGMIGDSVFDLKPDITTAMVQTLSNQISIKDNIQILDYLKSIELIIGEEAHEVSHEAYWNVLKHCPNAVYRLGLTATPFMRINSEANMKLMGAFGSLGIAVDEKTLIDRGILAKPIIKFAKYDRPEKLKFGSNYQKAVEVGISLAESRNKLIVSEVAKASSCGLVSLILVQRKEHGKVLEGVLTANGLRVEYIFGETSQVKRKAALNRLENKEIDALIGSTIVDVGIDVPAIGLVVMAGGGKAEVAYRQRIGRGLRAKSSGPNVCFILDLLDDHNEYLFNHFQERLGIIKATPGFVNEVIPSEEEFPYYLFK